MPRITDTKALSIPVAVIDGHIPSSPYAAETDKRLTICGRLAHGPLLIGWKSTLVQLSQILFERWV